MEKPEVETNYSPPDEGSQLNRNRSFKSKQLVRSQAIRESHSPPCVSPLPPADAPAVTAVSTPEVRRHTVEIQITQGTWDTEEQEESDPEHVDQHECSQLLSNNPRVSCVCFCAHCPLRRGRRRKQTSKQDSGISDECPDYSDTELSGGSNGNSINKSASLDLETTDPQTYCRCSERREKPKNIQLSRTDSDDKSDLSSVDLVNFIKATLNKNSKDRATLLKIEKELHTLINDSSRWSARFPTMTSYGRLLVHRAAALHALAHRLDPDNRAAVLVSKTGTSSGRIPCTSFKQWCSDTFTQNTPINTTQHKSILKRDAHSLDEGNSRDGGAVSRSKSLEQREKDYLRVRRRIFSSDNCSQDETQWPWLSAGPVKLLTPDTGRNKLLKVQSLETATGPSPQSWRIRPGVSKSHSFGGCGEAQPARLLSRQGDLASSSWRLSPSSSGYKTLSLRSTDSVTPSPTGGVSPEPASCPQTQGALLWAFTDLSCVPRGALIIHPQTGQPLTNPDGSLYRYDPANPPMVYEESEQTQGDQTSEIRRGRLEKQNSFIDNQVSECEPAESTDKSCYCECERQNSACQSEVCDKTQTPQESVSPPTPKTQYDAAPAAPGPTNRVAAFEPPTNRVAAFEPPTNQRPAREEENGEYAQGYEVQIQSSPPPRPASSQPTPNYGYDAHLKSHGNAQEHHLRTMPLTNMVYQTTIPPAGYYPNHCRMETQLPHPMYQQMAPPVAEEMKLTTQEEPTFRIDASYPYPPLEPYVNYTPQCVDPSAMQQRGYGVTYGQPMEQAVMPTYPISNVLVPQPYPAQYQHVQWPLQPMMPSLPANCTTPLQKPTSPPNIYLPQDQYLYNSQMYSMVQYPSFYPQNLVPQMYYQPVYPMVERPSSVKDETTPPIEDRKVPYKKFVKQSSYQEIPKRTFVRSNSVKSDVGVTRQDSSELAIKIQQIKTQMASLNTQESEVKDDKRRNNGNGILGSYHGHSSHHRVMGRPINDESQLSSAARAIVNSIRSMQAKTPHYNHYDNQRYQPRDQTYHKYENYQNGRNYQSHRFPKEHDGTEVDKTGRTRAVGPTPTGFRPPYVYRQMSPGTWCRRSPGDLPPSTNTPRRPPPDPRNQRRQ